MLHSADVAYGMIHDSPFAHVAAKEAGMRGPEGGMQKTNRDIQLGQAKREKGQKGSEEYI